MQTKIIKISNALNRELQSFLDSVGEDKVDTIYTLIAQFHNGIEVDIKVCNGDKPYVDAVIFGYGHDLGCLDVGDTLLGEYIFEDILGDTYKITVELETDYKTPTYRELAKRISQMTDEQKDSNVTVHVQSNDEWHPVQSIEITNVCDVLDDNHLYLEIEA